MCGSLSYFPGQYFAALLLLLAGRGAYGQAYPPAADTSHAKKYTYVERMPVFPAYEAADSTRSSSQRVIRFLNKGLHFPLQAVRDGVTGRVFFSFAVDAQGRTTDIRLVKGLRADVDSSVMRNARRLGTIRWQPGIQNGRPVRVSFTVPISFNVQPGVPLDSLDLGPYHSLALPLVSWSGTQARIPAGKGVVYGSCLQRLSVNSLGMGQYVRLVNLTTHKAVRINVKPILKSRRESTFCYALPAGRYALYQYEYPDPVWGSFKLHLENLRKPLAHSPTAALRATRYCFTVQAGQLHYLGTWNLANEREPLFMNEKELLDTAIRQDFQGLELGTARLAIPQ
ncbi:energy transducer TonB [Hymenobacter baengnokdamensis]|uniref:energy transducer TonB n=1 Tax=Hymenobacter baengnokdamensis TaxID=2615203 RepID=UPI0017867DEB|nr:energy transducer TonB [Hymenobacter baengnokdamensis]